MFTFTEEVPPSPSASDGTTARSRVDALLVLAAVRPSSVLARASHRGVSEIRATTEPAAASPWTSALRRYAPRRGILERTVVPSTFLAPPRPCHERPRAPSCPGLPSRDKLKRHNLQASDFQARIAEQWRVECCATLRAFPWICSPTSSKVAGAIAYHFAVARRIAILLFCDRRSVGPF